MVKNVFWWPFLCTFDSCCICICDIAHCQLLPGLWMHPRVPAPVFKPNHSFLTNFQLLLSIFGCFYLFPTISNYSLSILPISDHLYLFSSVFAQIRVFPHNLTYFFYHFQLFSAIFDHFHPFFITLTRISSPSTIMTHFRPPLFIFNHFWWFTITLTHFISQIWTCFRLLLFISDH